jgi:predicted nucleic acid-binding protein
MNKKKILIIGFGKMGLSHFSSFYKKNYTIYIVDKNINENIKNLSKYKLINKKIFLLKKIPVKQKYLLTICCTESKERFKLIKRFFKTNKTKFLLLEKFCFSSLNQFNQFNKNFNHKTKSFVNSWSYILAKKTGLKKKLNKFKINCNIKEGNLLANITHLFHFFSYFNNNNLITQFEKKIKIIRNIKRPLYDELSGIISVGDSKKNKMIIQTKKNLKYLMTFTIIQKQPKINYKISIKNNIIYFLNSKEKNKMQFPFSSKTTFVFLKNLLNNNFNYIPSFEKDNHLSKVILNNINAKIP